MRWIRITGWNVFEKINVNLSKLSVQIDKIGVNRGWNEYRPKMKQQSLVNIEDTGPEEGYI